jgi:hypothetical protein
MSARWAFAMMMVGAFLGASAAAEAQTARVPSIALVDSRGTIAGRVLSETIVLVTVREGLVAPAAIRPIYDPDARTASGLAMWASGGSVLFTSADCSTGAYISTQMHAGARATSQVETGGAIFLHVGAIGMPVTVDVRSILYGTGCTATTVHQNGLVPVIATLNLTATYPPPLSLSVQ